VSSQWRLLEEHPVDVGDVAATRDVAGHHQPRAVSVQLAAVLAGRQQNVLVLEPWIDLMVIQAGLLIARSNITFVTFVSQFPE